MGAAFLGPGKGLLGHKSQQSNQLYSRLGIDDPAKCSPGPSTGQDLEKAEAGVR